MIKSKRSALRRALLLSGCAMAACPIVSLAGVTFVSGSSTAKWTFDPDTAGGTQLKTINVNPPPSSSGMPAPPTYQLNQTFTLNNSTSTAKGSIGYVLNATTATFTLAAGTGVTQNDPNNANYPGDSLVRVDFSGLFNIDTTFGPPASGYVSIAVGGSVGAGGSTAFSGQVDFRNLNAGQLMRPTVSFAQTFTTPGAFSKTFTSSAILNPSTVPTSTKMQVSGFFQFTASNHHDQPSNIVPLDIEVGSAPPTATTYLSAGNTPWSSIGSWAPPPGSVIEDLGTPPPIPPDEYGGGEGGGEEGPIILGTPDTLMGHLPGWHPQPPTTPPPIDYNTQSIPTIPNGVGQRARIVNLSNATRVITLDSDVTLGALDLKSDGNLIINALMNKELTFETNGGNATIEARNINGSQWTFIDSKIILKNDLEIFAEGSYVPGAGDSEPTSSIYFRKSISSPNNSAIYKYGDGYAALNETNTYAGGTYVRGGILAANDPGSLGSGDVQADDGQLDYNARHAAKNGIAVEALNGGQINLGIIPGSDENFVVHELSAISGKAAELGALTNEPLTTSAVPLHFPGHGGDDSDPDGATNLHLAPGAMIAHEDWNTGSYGNPKNLGNTPLYIFGIADDFKYSSRSITVGTGSNSPWIGFGSDRTDRTFGTNPFTTSEKLIISGTASLASLHQTLFLNAQLKSDGSGSFINKVGKGTVAIENKNNTYNGGIDVQQGGLLVNGNLPNVTGITVQDGALLGGGGTIGGPVNILTDSDGDFIGGALSPGGNKPSNKIGTLTTGALTLGQLAELDFDFLDTTHYDKVVVNGDLTIDNFGFYNVNLSDLGSFGPGTYTLFQTVGGSVIGSDFFLETLADPNDDLSYSFDIVGGNSVVLTVTDPFPLPLAALPEPGALSVLAMGSLLCIRRRRK